MDGARSVSLRLAKDWAGREVPMSLSAACQGHDNITVARYRLQEDGTQSGSQGMDRRRATETWALMDGILQAPKSLRYATVSYAHVAPVWDAEF